MNSREKGKKGERELAGILKAHGYKARRGQQYCGTSGEADVVGIPGVHIECKRVEKLNIYTAMAQAVRDARPGEIPTVFHRKNQEGWLVTMRLEDYLDGRKEADEAAEYRSLVTLPADRPGTGQSDTETCEP
jgi:Holliday junction resolvase